MRAVNEDLRDTGGASHGGRRAGGGNPAPRRAVTFPACVAAARHGCAPSNRPSATVRGCSLWLSFSVNTGTSMAATGTSGTARNGTASRGGAGNRMGGDAGVIRGVMGGLGGS